VVNEHNHELYLNTIVDNKLKPEHIRYIEEHVVKGTTMSQMIQMLERVWTGRTFDERQVTNVLQQIRTDAIEGLKRKGGDIYVLANSLIEKKEEGWDYEMFSDPIDQRLSRVWWITPAQMDLLRDFGNVLVLDTSEGKNIYDYFLLTFVIVDGENVTRNVGYCIHDKQDAGSTHIYARTDISHVPMGLSEHGQTCAQTTNREWLIVFSYIDSPVYRSRSCHSGCCEGYMARALSWDMSLAFGGEHQQAPRFYDQLWSFQIRFLASL